MDPASTGTIGILAIGFLLYLTRPFWLPKTAGMTARAAIGCLILFFVVALVFYVLGVFQSSPYNVDRPPHL
jgi:hypothetical protein